MRDLEACKVVNRERVTKCSASGLVEVIPDILLLKVVDCIFCQFPLRVREHYIYRCDWFIEMQMAS